MTQLIAEFEGLLKRVDSVPARRDFLRARFEGDAVALAAAVKSLALQDLRRALAVSEGFDRVAWSQARERVHLKAARAHVLCYANQFADAMNAIREATALARAECSCEDLGQVELAAVQLLARQGDLSEAEQAARRALAAYVESGNPVAQGKSFLNLGIVLRMRERLGESLASFDAAQALVAGDPFLCGAVASNRAEALLDLDRFREAERSFESARSYFIEAGQHHAAAIVEGNLGDLLSAEGRVDGALEHFERSRRILESAGAHADAVRLTAEEAEALCAVGAFDAAIQMYAQCIPGLESAGLVKELTRARTGLALALCRTGAREEAQRALQQCSAAWKSLGIEASAAACDAALAALRIADGAVIEGRSAARRSLEALDDRPVRWARAQAGVIAALIDAGDCDAAEAELRLLQQRVDASGLLPLRIAINHLHGRLNLNRSAPIEASRHLSQAIRDAETLRATLRGEQHRLALGESWRQLYLDACRAGLEAGGDAGLALAFESIERVRSRTLLDAIGSERLVAADPDAGLKHPPDPIDQEHDECVELLNVLYNRLARASHEDAADTRDGLARLVDLEQRAARLRDRRDSLGCGRSPLREPLSLAEALEAIPEDGACIHYFEDGKHLSALVLQRAGVSAHRGLALLEDVSLLTSRMRFCVEQVLTAAPEQETRWKQSWQTSLGRIGEMLLDPLMPAIGNARQLALAAFGELVEVPWPAVAVRSGPLSRRFVVRTIPSVSAAAHLSRLGARSVRTMLSVGVADEAAPRMSAEARRAAALISGAQLLVDDEAVADRVLEAIAAADLVHLSTHCVYSPLHPMSSRVRLSDRWLTARELVAAVRPGSRFVLAGCESGREGGQSAEDRTGLVRALLASGASEVLAAVTPLQDADTERLFDLFYQTLSREPETASLAECLNHVQASLCEAGSPAWCWGNLTVTGGMK